MWGVNNPHGDLLRLLCGHRQVKFDGRGFFDLSPKGRRLPERSHRRPLELPMNVVFGSQIHRIVVPGDVADVPGDRLATLLAEVSASESA